MGYGNYSEEAHRALISGRSGVPREAIFQQQHCHPLMDPKGVRVRESRDSEEHPESLGIVFALDVTGSMGEIPVLLATRELPKFMKVLTSCSVRDPQVLFMAVGDATSDTAPLQVGQFETTAELMDQWLTRTFIESGGGGSGEESYELALYFLAQHTEMDCHVKRGRRGYLFLTGDENPYRTVSRHIVESVIGDRLDEDLAVGEVVAELQKTFVPFFLIPDQGRRAHCERVWRSLLGDHVLCMDSPEDVCYVSAGALLISEKLVQDQDSLKELLQRADI
ncbi:MAG TPA: VWA domain-containing protein, partial [Thermoanaerobaculia bacterium]|nr:VWA domain-containing protein [Thermoanaerobaculia bacterium]